MDNDITSPFLLNMINFNFLFQVGKFLVKTIFNMNRKLRPQGTTEYLADIDLHTTKDCEVSKGFCNMFFVILLQHFVPLIELGIIIILTAIALASLCENA